METSILIAKIIGVIYLSFGIGLLFNPKYYKTEFQNILNSTIFSLFGGIMAIIIGFIIVNNRTNNEYCWTHIITVIGWVAIVKGVLLLAYPKFSILFKPLFKSDLFYKILTPSVIVFGLVFIYFGFFA